MMTKAIIVLFILQLTNCANITVQPVSINTTLNSTVVFSCEATADDLTFRVNHTPADDEAVMDKGFSATSTNNGGTRRAELQGTAYEYNNNTEVRCRALTDKPLQLVFSDTAILMIQGLLASVVDLDYTFINGSSVLLSWTAPYTLDNVPITGYYIVNGLVNITTTNKSIILSATNPDPCILNNVSVSPINDAGIGSSNIISFYYETVPLITPLVSVIDGQLISLNISINVSTLCEGEYPNSITVNLLNTTNAVIKNTSIPTQVNDQLMITGVITVPNNLNTFIVNVSLSNNGGELLSSFGFGFLGPVTNIDSSIDNCSTISITWTAPTVDDRVSILYYILRIYDAITGSLVDIVSVGDTNYQFMDNDLFIHRYTYVITGVNELGEGISNNDTFSYQRVPRSVNSTTVFNSNYTQTNVTLRFNIPVTLECTDEAPENATVTIQCNGTGVVFTNIYLVAVAHTPMNMTGSVPIPLNQQCTITVVFSNGVGSSEPFILPFVTVSSTVSPTSSSSSSVLFISISFGGGGSILIVVVLVIACCLILVWCSQHRLNVHGNLSFSKSEPNTSDGSSNCGPITSADDTEPFGAPYVQATDTDQKAPTMGGAAKEPTYLELGVAPPTGTKPLPQTEAPSVLYADVDKIVPRSKATPQPQSYDDVAVSASGTTVIGATGGNEVMAKQVNKKKKQPKPSSSKKETTGAIGGGAAREPIYSDLAPPTGTKLAKTEAPSVYADIDKIVPRSKATVQPQSYVVVSAGSGTTVIGATGGDPPPIPDKKSKGADTTEQGVTNGDTDENASSTHIL